jgi:large subunit ribosomal protein L4
VQVPVRSTSGEITKQIEISDYVFGVAPNKAVAHQALLRQLANGRQGTASAKTRGEVAGSTKKLYAQKHTGRARPGSIKSPLRRGGESYSRPYRGTTISRCRKRCAVSRCVRCCRAKSQRTS